MNTEIHKKRHFSLLLQYRLAFIGFILGLFLLFWLLLGGLGRYTYNKWAEQIDTYGLITSLNTTNSSKKSEVFQKVLKTSESLVYAVPKDKRASYILKRISEGKKALKILDRKTKKEIVHRGYIEYPIEMNVYGSFGDLHQYLATLENMDIAIQVRELSLNTTAINQDDLNIYMELSAYVFTP
jgi:Tfp pilus assembly protein PilO